MSDSIHAVCPQCNTVNGVPVNKDSSKAKCGKCAHVLLPSGPIEVNDGSFFKFISRSGLPIVVDFWAPWCGPCKMMAPQFANAASQHRGKVIYLKLNTEQAQAIAGQYNIRSIPTMALFKSGQEIARTSGAMDADRIRQWVDSKL